MFPSDLVFFPVISESETLGFSGNPDRVFSAFVDRYPVRYGSPPCLLTPNTVGGATIPCKVPTALCRSKVFLVWPEL